MDKIEKMLLRIKQENFLIKSIELGINPKDIKNAVIDTLSPYFENNKILIKYSIDLLLPEFINLMKLKQDNWSFKMFESCFYTYRMAKNKNQLKCFESMAFWQKYIEESILKFWTIYNLERDKNMLESDKMVFECFRNIGDILEGLNKPYLKSLLCQIKIINGVTIDYQTIGNSELGKIVNKLIKQAKFPELFSPPPLKIKINQWRNIAYHHNFRLVNDTILLWYGKGKNRVETMIPKDHILQIAKQIFNCFKIQKLSHDIFFIDNIEAIKNYLPNMDDTIRFEALFTNIASGITSQGFEIINLEQNLDEAKLIVKDLTDFNSYERCTHASQFLYSLWLITKAKSLSVEYRGNDGTAKVLFKINSDVCKKFYRAELEFPDIAEEMDIIILKGNK
jgi:hypothetical protein